MAMERPAKVAMEGLAGLLREMDSDDQDLFGYLETYASLWRRELEDSGPINQVDFHAPSTHHARPIDPEVSRRRYRPKVA